MTARRQQEQQQQGRNGNSSRGGDGGGGGGGRIGGLRCVCGEFLIGARDQLLQCVQCHNWLHPLCVNIGLQPSLLAAAAPGFVCPFCTGSFKKRQRPETQTMVKLVEVPDARPTNAAAFDAAANAVRKSLAASGYTPVEFPHAALTDAAVEEAAQCCRTSIEDLTFSESYPRYCLQEQQMNHHPYLQGSAARTSTDGRRIVSVVLANGMDPYASLRQSLSQLRGGLTKGQMQPTSVTADALQITTIDDFVHFTLIVTDDAHRGRGLAKRLLLLEMARWCARGRTRGFLNMALEKKIVGDRTLCSVAEAPKRLYTQCGFFELCERVDADGREVWSKREEDLGRIMVNLDMPTTVRRLTAALAQQTAPDSPRRGRPSPTRPRPSEVIEIV